MPKWGMVIDLDKCTGCQACSVACQAENNIPNPDGVAAAARRTIHWMRLVTTSEGEYPENKVRQLPYPCMHC